jgi:hypothetical protein
VGVGEAVFQKLVGHLEVCNFRDVCLPLVAKVCREMPVLVQAIVQRLDFCIVFVPKTLCGGGDIEVSRGSRGSAWLLLVELICSFAHNRPYAPGRNRQGGQGCF